MRFRDSTHDSSSFSGLELDIAGIGSHSSAIEDLVVDHRTGRFSSISIALETSGSDGKFVS